MRTHSIQTISKKVTQATLVLLGLYALQPNLANAEHGGTNTGGDNSIKVFRTWCDKAELILEEANTDQVILYEQGNLYRARETLVEGIVQALKAETALTHPIDAGQSLTVRALTRGLEMVSAVETAAPSDLDRQVRILQHYYSFLTKTVSSFDRDYYYPAHHENQYKFDAVEFEHRYEAYAKEQLEWITSSFFIYTCSDAYAGKVNQSCISGSSAIFFKLAELITGYVAYDLSDTIVSTEYECTSERLNLLNDKIKQYNLGNSEIGSEDVALNIIILPKLNDIAKQIRTHSCIAK